MLSKRTMLLAGILLSAMATGTMGQQAVPGSDGWRHWGSPGAASVPRPGVKPEYLQVQVRIGDDTIYVDNQFRIYSGDGWSFIPVTFLYLEKDNADKPLRRTADQDFRVEWSVVIPPEEYAATWRDATVKFSKAELASAVDLPKGKRTVLWAVPVLWQIETKRYLPFGWEAAAPLAVTTDADGKITALETFPTSPQRLEPNHPSQTLAGNECKLETKHIRLKDDARLVKNAYGFQLLGPTSQIGLSMPGRGAFFGTIDSPEKARELFEVGLGGSRIIKDKKQYQAIAEPGRQFSKLFYAELPCGSTVTEVAGLGYCITALVLDYSPESGQYTGVTQYTVYISTNGVMADKSNTSGIAHANTAEFDKLVRPLLKDEWLEMVPMRVTVTDKAVTTPTTLNVPVPVKAP